MICSNALQLPVMFPRTPASGQLNNTQERATNLRQPTTLILHHAVPPTVRAKDTINQLKEEISNLSKLVEKGAGLSVGQENMVKELIRVRDELTRKTDEQGQTIGVSWMRTRTAMRWLPHIVLFDNSETWCGTWHAEKTRPARSYKQYAVWRWCQ